MKRTITILAGAAALALALTSTASAADRTLAALGSKSNAASLKFTTCTTRLCKAKAARAFLAADTQFANHLAARLSARTITPATPCFRAAMKLALGPRNAKPWLLTKGWVAQRVGDGRFIGAQIRFVQQALKVARAC